VLEDDEHAFGFLQGSKGCASCFWRVKLADGLGTHYCFHGEFVVGCVTRKIFCRGFFLFFCNPKVL